MHGHGDYITKPQTLLIHSLICVPPIEPQEKSISGSKQRLK